MISELQGHGTRPPVLKGPSSDAAAAGRPLIDVRQSPGHSAAGGLRGVHGGGAAAALVRQPAAAGAASAVVRAAMPPLQVHSSEGVGYLDEIRV